MGLIAIGRLFLAFGHITGARVWRVPVHIMGVMVAINVIYDILQTVKCFGNQFVKQFQVKFAMYSATISLCRAPFALRLNNEGNSCEGVREAEVAFVMLNFNLFAQPPQVPGLGLAPAESLQTARPTAVSRWLNFCS